MGWMTIACHLADDLRVEIATPELRRNIVRLVGSRVPAVDADDVVQSALCAALTSAHVPNDPTKRVRWLFGIVRHKIADYYRVGRREAPLMMSAAAVDAAHAEDVGDSVETRQLLERIFDDVQSDARAAQTLAWIVREHGGESLSEIARKEAVSAASVRQRVSRMRRALRAKWLPLAAAMLACGALWMHWPHDANGGVDGVPAATIMHGAQGTWNVSGVFDDGARVVVSGNRFVAAGTFGELHGHLEIDDGVVTVTTTTGRSLRLHLVHRSDNQLVLAPAGGVWPRRVVLER